jgi:hypothetical protein
VQKPFIFSTVLALLLTLASSGAAQTKAAKIRGYVTAVRSSTDFDIEDYRITRSEAFTLDFENASPDVVFTLQDIRIGVELEIKGTPIRPQAS